MGGARFRQRKLSTKQTLQILREDQVDQVDDDAQRNIPKVDTGVEKGEEIVSRFLNLVYVMHMSRVPSQPCRQCVSKKCMKRPQITTLTGE